jgi:hypothetical protein
MQILREYLDLAYAYLATFLGWVDSHALSAIFWAVVFGLVLNVLFYNWSKNHFLRATGQRRSVSRY